MGLKSHLSLAHAWRGDLTRALASARPEMLRLLLHWLSGGLPDGIGTVALALPRGIQGTRLSSGGLRWHCMKVQVSFLRVRRSR